MKVKFNRKKGNRVLKGTVKIHGKNKRIPMYMGLTCTDNIGLMWAQEINKWVSFKDSSSIGNYTLCTHSGPIRSVKAAIRHIKKHNEIPKGTSMTLVSSFVGYDVIITK